MIAVVAACLAVACRQESPPRPADSAVVRVAHPIASPSSPAAPQRSAPLVQRRHIARRLVFGGVDFTGAGHDRGDPNAPVVLIDLSDFACPYCGEFSRDVYPALDREYVQRGKVLFKYIPFVAGSFVHATEATRAAECAAEQGGFWRMLDRLYATQAEWKRSGAPDAALSLIARSSGLDSARYDGCYADRHTDRLTNTATSLANDLGVRVTPSFLVNGNPVQGALPLPEFRKQIETALLLARAAQGAR